jgi:ATP-dependent exoDNAse (exonuclease V) beta subunit
MKWLWVKTVRPVRFKDDNRWVRGIVDLLIVDNDYAFIVDYKTGSHKYPDPKQLRLDVFDDLCSLSSSK